MTYIAESHRYETMTYRHCGKSGLKLPPLSLGLWHNFGDATPLDVQRSLLCTAFDHGITHFDLANNYGPPFGSAEINFGRLFKDDFKPYRDELIISTKAGWDMWPGPYGQGGGSRKYVLASLDQSLERMGLDYVDIFYSHRFDADTPLEETMGALATAVQQGRALYVGISSYSAAKTNEAAAILRDLKTPLLIHQPSYNMLNRWIEKDLLDTRDPAPDRVREPVWLDWRGAGHAVAGVSASHLCQSDPVRGDGRRPVRWAVQILGLRHRGGRDRLFARPSDDDRRKCGGSIGHECGRERDRVDRNCGWRIRGRLLCPGAVTL